MDEPPHAARAAGLDRVVREIDVHARERVAPGFVEDADEVHDRVGAAHERRERRGVVHVRLDDVDRGQQDQAARRLAAPDRHDDRPALGRESRDEHAPDEPAAAEHDDRAAAGPSRGGAAPVGGGSRSERRGDPRCAHRQSFATREPAGVRGPTVPSRCRTSTDGSPSACA